MSFGARARIRLGALKHNFSHLKATLPGVNVMAVIKANAYGHGLITVAKNLPDADALAVARVPEAVALRDAGIETNIVLLSGVVDADELELALQHKLQLVVHCEEQLALLENHVDSSVVTWLKVDVGMNRLGFRPSQVAEARRRLRDSGVAEVRMMSHFSSADDTQSDVTPIQARAFLDVVDDQVQHVSLCNSAAALAWPTLVEDSIGHACTQWIRPGIALFGISPFADQTSSDLGLRPVMQFEARLIAVKDIYQGNRVGYQQSYECPADSRLGLISVGYGDGYSRHFRSGTPVLINGRRVPVVGNVSMDLIAVDLGANANDRVGDTATLWGEGLPAEEVAPWAGAIPYELVCGVMQREERQLVD